MMNGDKTGKRTNKVVGKVSPSAFQEILPEIRSQKQLDNLKAEIRATLKVRRRDDPCKSCEVEMDSDVFEQTFGDCKIAHKPSLKDLVPVLGANWFFRILNENGDVAYVKDSITVKWIQRPVVDYTVSADLKHYSKRRIYRAPVVHVDLIVWESPVGKLKELVHVQD